MIVTKKVLPRRTFLRGAGAALALPLLDAMVAPLTAMAATASPQAGQMSRSISALRRAQRSPVACTGDRAVGASAPLTRAQAGSMRSVPTR